MPLGFLWGVVSGFFRVSLRFGFLSVSILGSFTAGFFIEGFVVA